MSIYTSLKTADPAATATLLEITGHVFSGDRGGLTSWCRRIGVSIEEFDAVVRDYRVGIDRGERQVHAERF